MCWQVPAMIRNAWYDWVTFLLSLWWACFVFSMMSHTTGCLLLLSCQVFENRFNSHKCNIFVHILVVWLKLICGEIQSVRVFLTKNRSDYSGFCVVNSTTKYSVWSLKCLRVSTLSLWAFTGLPLLKDSLRSVVVNRCYTTINLHKGKKWNGTQTGKAWVLPAQRLVLCQQLSQHLSSWWSQVIPLWTIKTQPKDTQTLCNKIKLVSPCVESLIWELVPSDPGLWQSCCQTVHWGALWHLRVTHSTVTNTSWVTIFTRAANVVYCANEKRDLYECAPFLCLFVAFKKDCLHLSF